MNTWLSWRPDARIAQAVRAVLHRGTRVSHLLFSVVGACAVAVTIALWLLPTVRGTLAAKLMPVVLAAVQAGPARLLSGHPLPPFAPENAAGDDVVASGQPKMDNTRYDGACDGSGASGQGGVGGVAALDPRSTVDLDSLAKMVSSKRVAAE